MENEINAGFYVKRRYNAPKLTKFKKIKMAEIIIFLH